MRKPIVGRTYLYRSFGGQAFHVTILKVGTFFSLAQNEVHFVDFTYDEYDTLRITWRPNWRII